MSPNSQVRGAALSAQPASGKLATARTKQQGCEQHCGGPSKAQRSGTTQALRKMAESTRLPVVALVVALWYAANILVVISNKAILAHTGFSYPVSDRAHRTPLTVHSAAQHRTHPKCTHARVHEHS